MILPAEIQAASRASAYDAVLKLRPDFFTVSGRYRPAGQPAILPSVVLDQGPPEPIDVLRQIPAVGVVGIEFVERSAAQMRFGTAYSAGIIIVRVNTPP